MAQNKLKDGMVLGALFGLVLTTPKISAPIADFLANILPQSWQFLDSWSLSFYGLALGALIGLIIDKT